MSREIVHNSEEYQLKSEKIEEIANDLDQLINNFSNFSELINRTEIADLTRHFNDYNEQVSEELTKKYVNNLLTFVQNIKEVDKQFVETDSSIFKDE